MSTAEHASRPQGEDATAPAEPATPAEPAALTILLYSDDPKTRDQVMLAIGRRPASDLGPVEYVECDLADVVVEIVEGGGVDLAILDGEAAPVGGMGLCRQLKNEVRRCPPILLLIGRRDDRWLAVWSQADAAVAHPIDAILLVDTTVDLLRSAQRRAGQVIRSR
jgi:DNA-binding response OmpR family regulator